MCPYLLVDLQSQYIWIFMTALFWFFLLQACVFFPAGINLQAEFTGMKQIKFDDSNWPHVSVGQQPSVLLTSSWPCSVQLGVCTSGHSIGSHWMLMESSSHTQFLQSLVHLSPGWMREKCVWVFRYLWLCFEPGNSTYLFGFPIRPDAI